MGWLSLIKAALSLFSSVMSYVQAERERGLGAKEAMLKGLQEAQNAVDKARQAREMAVSDYDPDSFDRDR